MTPIPTIMHTRSSLADELRAAGLEAGIAVLLHSSMSRVGGWICGGAEAVVLALMDALTPAGTLMMPTFTPDNTDPRHWRRPPVPPSWWPIIRAQTPAYDPRCSRTQRMGAIPETFRQYPDVDRSSHPITSFAAWGAQRDYLLQTHPLEAGFGEDSPLGRLYTLGGAIFMLGTGHAHNTSMHLAEHRLRLPRPMVTEGCAMLVDGVRQWVEFRESDYDDALFEAIGADYEARHHPVIKGKVGEAVTRLLPMRPLVDFTVAWLDAHTGL